jgi:hypothetical protein
METALSVISQLPENREQQKTWVNACVEEFVNGNNDPVRLYAKLRIIADAVKDVLDAQVVKNYTTEELKKFNGEDVSVFGNKVTIGTRRSWDYSVCGDPEIELLEWTISDAKERIAARQKFLQLLKERTTFANEETGDMITINPPTYTVSEFPVVK